ncbi:MAG: GNAT family N-acetyltransferase [Oscillospiraceae bacterium]|nr:GNAT family N-acetyltransferase [Oscillospiraceae bacterium]
MIKQIYTAEEFSALPENGIEAGKIRALYFAYGAGYPFCRFYRQGNCYFSCLDGAYVICGEPQDTEELSQFLAINGYTEIFCTEVTADRLSESLEAVSAEIFVMRFSGGISSVEPDYAPPLSDVYSIVSEGFDIDFEPWYLDMSHRVRHGVTRCAVLDGEAALVIQHHINGEALISQVACRKDSRGKGYASRLVVSAACSLAPSEVYVLCEEQLVPFYEKCGFSFLGKKYVLSHRAGRIGE